MLHQHIPKIIHQIWIGPNQRPQKWLDTWKEKNPDWEYRLWTDDNLPLLENQRQFALMSHYSGKADILRYELLYRYGGFYIDADSECIRPLSESFLHYHFLAFYENKLKRKGLITQAVFACEPFHPIMRMLIDAIAEIDDINIKPPWVVVGPILFTKVIEAYKKEGHKVRILPSYLFCPMHFDGDCYSGRGKIYSIHHWKTTKEMHQQVDIASTEAYSCHDQRQNLKRKERILSKKSTQEVIALLKELDIRTILDAPCGDFKWLGDASLDPEMYLGIDFSPQVIDRNQNLYARQGRCFECLDLVLNPLPEFDMILCLDCFPYLSAEEIYTALLNFVKSGSKYLITTNYPEIPENRFSQTGEFRPINLSMPPFSLPPPLREIKDGDQVLALFHLNKTPEEKL